MAEFSRLRMPEHLLARARLLVGLDQGDGGSEGAGTPAGKDWRAPPLRHAGTIVLLRDTDAGVEVYLQRRVSTMAFAAGMYVFPGGAVDPIDIERAQAWVDSTAQMSPPSHFLEFASRASDTIGEDTLAARFAAVRETSEEAGVDLGEGVALSMSYIAHWATPAVEDRRYDTRFYAVALEASGEVAQTSGESDRHAWLTPSQALDEYGRGDLLMLPPTVAVLSSFVRLTKVSPTLEHDAQALAHALGTESVLPLMPHPVADPDQPGGISWNLVDVRTEKALTSSSGAPAGSESGGVHTSLIDREGRPS